MIIVRPERPVQNKFASWPNGKRIAIAITPLFSVWPDGKDPANLVQRAQVKRGIAGAMGVR